MQFCILRHAIAVNVHPHPQFAEHRVLCVEATAAVKETHLVVIVVDLIEHAQPAFGPIHPGVIEQIRPPVDLPVCWLPAAVPVQHQDPVTRANPIRLFRKAIVVHVKQHPIAGCFLGHGNHAIAVQVQRNDAGGLLAGLGDELARQVFAAGAGIARVAVISARVAVIGRGGAVVQVVVLHPVVAGARLVGYSLGSLPRILIPAEALQFDRLHLPQRRNRPAGGHRIAVLLGHAVKEYLALGNLVAGVDVFGVRVVVGLVVVGVVAPGAEHDVFLVFVQHLFHKARCQVSAFQVKRSDIVLARQRVLEAHEHHILLELNGGQPLGNHAHRLSIEFANLGGLFLGLGQHVPHDLEKAVTRVAVLAVHLHGDLAVVAYDEAAIGFELVVVGEEFAIQEVNGCEDGTDQRAC